jgi:hypothetical protein
MLNHMVIIMHKPMLILLENLHQWVCWTCVESIVEGGGVILLLCLLYA